jgi:hypothetical protein
MQIKREAHGFVTKQRNLDLSLRTRTYATQAPPCVTVTSSFRQRKERRDCT